MGKEQTAEQQGMFREPLKPRRGLFVLGLVLVGAWCAVLVGMFVMTVYPHPEEDPHRRGAATRGE